MPKTKRKICVITGSRAEYSLLYWLMKEIGQDKTLSLSVVVCGMHLVPKFGLTYKQILKDGFKVSAKVEMPLSCDQDYKIAIATGIGIKKFSEVFRKLNPDLVVMLGDRFEILAASVSALLCRIPIAHIHGGELTQGAYDDCMRHAITKMAYLHFTSHEDYARRVIQMGEDPRRVFNFGALCLDNIKKLRFLSKEKIEKIIGLKLDANTALVTFHPVTMKKGLAKTHIDNLIKALDGSKLKTVFTMPNADAENTCIFETINKYVQNNPNKAKAFKSLGQVNYLSLMKYIGLVVGNSSSGVIEAPYFKVPVVDIGNRQKGRIKAKNIVECKEDIASISKAIEKATSKKFRDSIRNSKNPFGNGEVAAKIKKVLKDISLADVAKEFYDLE